MRKTLALVVVLAALAGGAHAQTSLSARPGPFVSLDLGSPLVLGPDGAFGVSAGYRVGGRGEVSLRVERGSVSVLGISDTGRTFAGVGSALSYGPERSPVQFEAVVGLAVDDQSDLVDFYNSDPENPRTEFLGGPRLAGLHAAVSAVKLFPLSSGAVRFYVGGGPFVEASRETVRDLEIDFESPDQRLVEVNPRTFTSAGADLVLTAPLAVRVGQEADLVIAPTVRFDLSSGFLDFEEGRIGFKGYPHVRLRLDW